MKSLMRMSLCLRFLPRREPLLDVLDDLHERDAEQRNDDDRHEHLGGLEEIAVLYDHAAEAGDRGEELGDDHGEHAAPDCQPQAGHDERQRRRQHDLPEDLPLAGAEGGADVDHALRQVLHAAEGVDDDDEHRQGEDDDDLGNHAHPEPQDEERDQRDRRRRIERVHVGLENVLEHAHAAHGDADGDTDDDGEGDAEGEGEQARRNCLRQLAGGRQVDQRHGDRRRRREEERVDVPAGDFPAAQHHDERDCLDEELLAPRGHA
jgi:hypothetical protein